MSLKSMKRKRVTAALLTYDLAPSVAYNFLMALGLEKIDRQTKEIT